MPTPTGVGTGVANAGEFVERLEASVAAQLAAAPAPMSIPLAIVVLAKRRRSA